MNEPKEVKIASITIPDRHRKTTAKAVDALVESILSVGLLNPIGITTGNALIHGRHRLEAFAAMGRSMIPAIVHELDELHAELAELDENLRRNDPNALERSKCLKRRKEIYLALHPETKAGIAGGKAGGRGREKIASDNMSFAIDTSANTGQSRRTIERDVEIAEKLDEEAAEAIADTPIADNKAELTRLGKLEPAEQRKAAAKIKTGKAKTVAEATGGGKPKVDHPALAKLESKIGEAMRAADAIHKATPSADHHGDVMGHLKKAINCVVAWRKGIR